MDKKEEKRPKIQRILALVGVILLVGLYLITLLSAVFTTPATKGLFLACVFATIAIPVMIYGYMLIYKVFKERDKVN